MVLTEKTRERKQDKTCSIYDREQGREEASDGAKYGQGGRRLLLVPSLLKWNRPTCRRRKEPPRRVSLHLSSGKKWFGANWSRGKEMNEMNRTVLFLCERCPMNTNEFSQPTNALFCLTSCMPSFLFVGGQLFIFATCYIATLDESTWDEGKRAADFPQCKMGASKAFFQPADNLAVLFQAPPDLRAPKMLMLQLN